MDDIKQPRRSVAPIRGRTAAANARQAQTQPQVAPKPDLVWNPTTRQWWTPPTKTEEIPAPTVVQRPVVHQPVVTPKPRIQPVHHAAPKPKPQPKKVTINLSFKRPKLNKKAIKTAVFPYLKKVPKPVYAAGMLVIIAVMLLNVVTPLFTSHAQADAYALSNSEKKVIAQPTASLAKDLTHDVAKGTFDFNAGAAAATNASSTAGFGGAEAKATFNEDASKGITVTDPNSQSDFTVTPLFGTLAGKQTQNQVQYPMTGADGSLVYTAAAVGVKEDVLLKSAPSDTAQFKYKLGLGSQYAAKLQSDGSLGIYGSSLPINNVSTSDAKDAALLQKAQAQATKDTLLFSFPSPIIHATGNGTSKVKAKFSISGDTLTVTATHLKTASYPLSIDPTISIVSISDFYRNTSIESNADFNLVGATGSITRGAITGGTTGTWVTAGSNLNTARFLNGAAAYNGYVYVVGGSNSTSATTNIAGNSTNMVEFASIDPTASTFGTFTAGNNSGLPAGGLSRFQLIAYKGFIYAIGGSQTDTTCNSLSTTVYYASVQVNGVLSNWSTTNAPTTARCSFGAAAYNGKIYIAGGKSGTSATSTVGTDVSYATENPNGTLTWTNGVSPALPAARYGEDLQAYNGYLYVVGGDLNGTLTNTVLYASLNTDGSIFGSWQSTNNFTTARENFGSLFSGIKNGYLYVSGGCATVTATASATCNAGAQNDNQVAQINADGSLGQWASSTTLLNNQVGASFVVWRGYVYSIGGCAATNTTNLYCTTALATNQFSKINAAGQASVLKTGVNQLSVPVFGAAAAVLGGYLYVVGGCITLTCTSASTVTNGVSDTSNQTYYAQINTDGTLGVWQNTAANSINGTNATAQAGLAETALVAANGSLFAFGGYNRSGPLQYAYSVTPSPTTGALPGIWTQSSTTILPATNFAASVTYFNGAFYLFGGCVSGAGTFGCTTYRTTSSKFTWQGGANWTFVGAQTALPTTANYPSAAMGLAFYDGYVYLCGGAAAAQAQTQYCAYDSISSAGTVGATWSLASGLLNHNTPVQDYPIRRGQAYASNGYLYVYSGHDAGGTNPGSVGYIDIGKINQSTGDVSTFNVSTTAFTPKWDTASAFANGNIYTVGGCVTGTPPGSCTAASKITEYFQVYDATNSGSRAITNITNAIPTAVAGAATTVSNGYIYETGGCSSYTVTTGVCTTAIGNSSFAKINPDGSLGAFAAGPSLPSGALRGFGCMVALNGTLYFMGGATSGGTAQAAVYYSTATGASWGSGTWATTTNQSLPAASGLSCTTYNNRIYTTGGSTSTAVYYSPTQASGGDILTSWTSTNAFTTTRSYHAAVAVGGFLYVMGGLNGTTYLSDVQYAQINANGSVGTWSYTADLPYKMDQMGAYAANGYIYLLGGSSGLTATSCMATTLTASVNVNGPLGAWQQGVATSFAAVEAAGVGYYNGYYYLVGGSNCSANIQTVSYAGEQSQAIRSIFTRYIDMLGDATPEKFVAGGNDALVNGIDISQWQMSYASSSIAANTFGQATVINPIPFGPNPFVMTALTAGGTNYGVSRYWSLTFSVDQAQSFTFTDADTTPPTISSYNFYYAPSGNTRLRNGRIFQDQTKQSLDVHP